MGTSALYVRVRGKVMGPFSVTQLQSLRDRGQFRSFHEISEDRNGWRPASTLPGMFGAEPAAAAAPAAQTAARVQAAPPEEEWYYVADNGKKIGPVGREQLSRLFRQGIVRADTQVWLRDTPSWVAFSASGVAGPAAQESTQEAESATGTGPLRSFMANPVGGLPQMIAGLSPASAAGYGMLFYLCFLWFVLLAVIASGLFRDAQIFRAIQELANNPARIEIGGKILLMTVLPLLSFWATISILRIVTRSHGTFGGDGLIAGALFVVPGLLLPILVLFIGVSAEVCLFILYFLMTIGVLQLNAAFSKSLKLPDLGIIFAIPAAFLINGWLINTAVKFLFPGNVFGPGRWF